MVTVSTAIWEKDESRRQRLMMDSSSIIIPSFPRER